MLRSTIITNARKHTNDTDTSTPFHTDNQCHAILDNWEREVRRRIQFPRKSQSISFTAGQGGNTDARDLDSDWLAITKALLIPIPATQYEHRVVDVVTEDVQDDKDAAWRDRTEQAAPSRIVLLGAVTADAAEYSNLQVATDRVVDGSYTVRLSGVQLNAAVTDGTKSPTVPGVYHTSAEFYLSAYMMLPRNSAKSADFMRMFEVEFKRSKSQGGMVQNEIGDIWGQVPNLG